MGYLAFAILIGVIIWTLWRTFTRKRLPLDYFTARANEEESQSESQDDMKKEEITHKK
ncbi:hypothetical protein [Paenisporosarcina indica]|uniref:hypothetical protein n=1 Tax=Paenisporosarcina indica TaxID=650093 RepID=UPI000B0FD691|nr:hypothetical protein [Paenisporosarcina indica]